MSIPGLFEVFFYIQNGSTAGWCTLEMGSETGASVTVYGGSVLEAKRIV
jgi:hypothetical protein